MPLQLARRRGGIHAIDRGKDVLLGGRASVRSHQGERTRDERDKAGQDRDRPLSPNPRCAASQSYGRATQCTLRPTQLSGPCRGCGSSCSWKRDAASSDARRRAASGEPVARRRCCASRRSRAARSLALACPARERDRRARPSTRSTRSRRASADGRAAPVAASVRRCAAVTSPASSGGGSRRASRRARAQRRPASFGRAVGRQPGGGGQNGGCSPGPNTMRGGAGGSAGPLGGSGTCTT